MVTITPRVTVPIKPVITVLLSKVFDSFVRLASGLHSKTLSYMSVIFHFFFSLNFINYLCIISAKTEATTTKVRRGKFTWEHKKII